jgi:antitoxin VapB
MPLVTSKTFKSGNSVAVRLPKEVALEAGVEVTIVRSGDVITIYPSRLSIAEMLRRMAELPSPGEIQERDVDIVPERPGL